VALQAAGDGQRSAMSAARKLKAGVQYAFNRFRPSVECRIYAGALVRSDPRLEQPDLQINMSGWSALERLRTGIKPHPFSAFTFSPCICARGPRVGADQEPGPMAPPAIQFQLSRQRL